MQSEIENIKQAIKNGKKLYLSDKKDKTNKSYDLSLNKENEIVLTKIGDASDYFSLEDQEFLSMLKEYNLLLEEKDTDEAISMRVWNNSLRSKYTSFLNKNIVIPVKGMLEHVDESFYGYIVVSDKKIPISSLDSRPTLEDESVSLEKLHSFKKDWKKNWEKWQKLIGEEVVILKHHGDMTTGVLIDAGSVKGDIFIKTEQGIIEIEPTDIKEITISGSVTIPKGGKKKLSKRRKSKKNIKNTKRYSRK
jgi:hypothetical protein